MMRSLAPGAILLVLLACSDERPSVHPQPAGAKLVLEGADPVGEGIWQVDFGAVAVGETEERQLLLRNEGDAAATLEATTRVSPFSLRLERSTLAPGTSVDLLAVFTPGTSGAWEAAGWIEGGDVRVEIRFAGEGLGGDLSCVEVGPQLLDFGEVNAGCEAVGRVATVENACEGPVRLTIEAAGGPFAVDASVPAIAVLPARASIEVPVHFAPEEAGAFAGALVLGDTTGARKEIELSGDALGERVVAHTDEWGPIPRIPTAALFVIDDGPAIEPWRERLRTLGVEAGHELGSEYLDLVAGVTTASLEGPCARDGALLASQGETILTHQMAGLPQRLADLLDVEICEGAAPPQPLRAAALALPQLLAAPVEEQGPIESVLLYIVSASDDAGGEPVGAELAAIRDVIGERIPFVRVVHPAAVCEMEDDGARLRAFGEASFADMSTLCAERWPSTDTVIVESTFRGRLTHFPADRNGDGVVDAADITVTIAGVETPAGEAWTYDPIGTRIVLNPLRSSSYEERIAATYLAHVRACGDAL